MRVQITPMLLVKGLLTLAKTFAQSIAIYYAPRVYNSFTEELACAQQEVPNSNTLIAIIAMTVTGVLVVDLLTRLVCNFSGGFNTKDEAHPMLNEFLTKVLLASIIVTKGLYNPYFSLVSFAIVLAVSPISWTLPRSLRLAYALLLLAAATQILRQYYSWNEFASEYMTDAICAEYSNWHFFYSMVAGGSLLSSLQTLSAQ